MSACPTAPRNARLPKSRCRTVLIAGMGDSDRRRRRQSRPADRARRRRLLLPPVSGRRNQRIFPARPRRLQGQQGLRSGLLRRGNTAADWARLNARWWSAACHRSLYGYQLRTALGARGRASACRGHLPAAGLFGPTIEVGFFGSLRARECPPTGSCASSTPPQLGRLKEALDLARKQNKERKLDLDPAHHRRQRHLVFRPGRQCDRRLSAPSARCSARAA